MREQVSPPDPTELSEKAANSPHPAISRSPNTDRLDESPERGQPETVALERQVAALERHIASLERQQFWVAAPLTLLVVLLVFALLSFRTPASTSAPPGTAPAAVRSIPPATTAAQPVARPEATSAPVTLPTRQATSIPQSPTTPPVRPTAAVATPKAVAAPLATPAATLEVAPSVTPKAIATSAPTALPAIATATAVPPATPAPTAPLAVVATITVGQSLCDLVVDDAGRHVYLSDDGPEKLLALDPATGQATGQYPVGDSLCSIALDPKGPTVYAPTWHRSGPNRYDGSQVETINTDTGALKSFPDGQYPSGPYFDEQKRVLYVGNTAQPSLLSIDAVTGVTKTFTLPVRINRVAVSSTNGSLFLASPGDNQVVVFDPASDKIVASLVVGQRPWGVVADPQTGRVLVSSEFSGDVSLIDPTTNKVLRTTPTGSHPRNLAVGSATRRFYVLNVADRTVSVLDSDGALLSTSGPLPGVEEPTGLATAGQTGQVFVVSKTHVYTLR